MWYLRKLGISFEQFGPVSTYLCAKYMKISSKNLGTGRENENGHRLLLVSIMKTNFPIYFAKIELFFKFGNQK